MFRVGALGCLQVQLAIPDRVMEGKCVPVAVEALDGNNRVPVIGTHMRRASRLVLDLLERLFLQQWGSDPKRR